MLVLVFGVMLVQGQVRTEHQNRTAHWIFGDGVHVDFSSGAPTLQPQIIGYFADEGVSCISDIEGNLLFFCNTQQVWNRNFELLGNSSGLNSGISAFGSSKTQGSLLLPWPGDTADKYFALFHMDDVDNKIYISKIDKLLDDGLGGIMPTYKRQLVYEDVVSEQLIAIRHANGRDWWIIFRCGFPIATHFVSKLFTSSGMADHSILSDAFISGFAGQMAASIQGNRLALVNTLEPSWVSIFEFDRCAGSIVYLDKLNAPFTSSGFFYGASFSPDGTRLFVSTVRHHSLYEFIVVNDTIELGARLLYLNGPGYSTVGNQCGMLQNNSYINIYMSMVTNGDDATSIPGYAEFLGSIQFDESSMGYLLDTFSIYLNGRENFSPGLPNFPNYDLGPLVGSPCDTLSPPDTTQVGLPVFSSPPWSWSVTPTVSGSSFQVSSSQPARLVVHDLYGRELLSMDCAGQCGFDLIEHPAGWYVVSLTDERGQHSEARKVLWQP